MPDTLIVVSFPVPRLLSLLALFALVGAACGGSDGETDTSAAPAAADAGTDDAGSSDASDDGDSAAAPDDDATEADTGSEAEPVSWPHTFVADQIGGGQIDANDLAGRDVVLWFWAPW